MGGSESSSGGQLVGGAPANDAAGAAGQPPIAAIDPASLKGAGLVMWLQADECSLDSNDRVESCSDLSGADNDATQLDPVRRPLHQSLALNGHAALRFDGASSPPSAFAASILRVEDNESLHFGRGDFAVVVVARWSNDPKVIYTVNNGFATVHYAGYAGLIQKTEVNSPYTGISLFANYPLGSVNVPTIPRFAAQLEFAKSVVFSTSTDLNDDSFRVLTAHRFDDDKLRVRINGQPQNLSQVSANLDLSAYYQPLLIGGQDAQPLRGDIVEVLVVKGATSDATLLGLETQLMQRYSL